MSAEHLFRISSTLTWSIDFQTPQQTFSAVINQGVLASLKALKNLISIFHILNFTALKSLKK
jgi:hypothetical protein